MTRSQSKLVIAAIAFTTFNWAMGNFSRLMPFPELSIRTNTLDYHVRDWPLNLWCWATLASLGWVVCVSAVISYAWCRPKFTEQRTHGFPIR
jgi:hypothetical protein